MSATELHNLQARRIQNIMDNFPNGSLSRQELVEARDELECLDACLASALRSIELLTRALTPEEAAT